MHMLPMAEILSSSLEKKAGVLLANTWPQAKGMDNMGLWLAKQCTIRNCCAAHIFTETCLHDSSSDPAVALDKQNMFWATEQGPDADSQDALNVYVYLYINNCIYVL